MCSGPTFATRRGSTGAPPRARRALRCAAEPSSGWALTHAPARAATRGRSLPRAPRGRSLPGTTRRRSLAGTLRTQSFFARALPARAARRARPLLLPARSRLDPWPEAGSQWHAPPLAGWSLTAGTRRRGPEAPNLGRAEGPTRALRQLSQAERSIASAV